MLQWVGPKYKSNFVLWFWRKIPIFYDFCEKTHFEVLAENERIFLFLTISTKKDLFGGFDWKTLQEYSICKFLAEKLKSAIYKNVDFAVSAKKLIWWENLIMCFSRKQCFDGSSRKQCFDGSNEKLDFAVLAKKHDFMTFAWNLFYSFSRILRILWKTDFTILIKKNILRFFLQEVLIFGEKIEISEVDLVRLRNMNVKFKQSPNIIYMDGEWSSYLEY